METSVDVSGLQALIGCFPVPSPRALKDASSRRISCFSGQR